MDKIAKLKTKIDQIDSLKTTSLWGAEYQLWIDQTENLVKETFGERGLSLFKQQGSALLDEESYIHELDSRKKILEGLLLNQNEYSVENLGFGHQKYLPALAAIILPILLTISRIIWRGPILCNKLPNISFAWGKSGACSYNEGVMNYDPILIGTIILGLILSFWLYKKLQKSSKAKIATVDENPTRENKLWYEKPAGIIILAVISTLIAGFFSHLFGWS